MKLFANNPRPPRGQSAMTLIEMVVAFGIATLFVLWVISFTSITFTQGIFALGNYADLNTKSRNTLDVMTRDIRGASALTAYATNSITLTNIDGASFSYTWDGSKFTRVYNGVSTVLMTNCDYLTFGIYQRNPTNDYTFVSSVSTPNLTKLIDVSWRCSRSYLGNKLNTESVQTARIVIRN